MFGRAISCESWECVARRTLIGIALLMLAPAGVMTAIALAFMLVPVAVVGIPFMLPVFFGTAAAEHKHEQEHRALPAFAPAVAH